MARVLVTGSAGAVGQAVCRELGERGHAVRGLDRVPTAGLDDALVADVTEPEAARASCRGIDAVVHLAAHPNDAPFAKLVGPNVIGVQSILDAAREEHVPRVVLASTLMVVWHGRDPVPAARVDEAHPMNHYALTKLWAEQMGEMYARKFEMSVVALRLTWMVRDANEARAMQAGKRFNIYVSRRDAGRAFAAAVEAPPDLRFAVAYVCGLDGAALFDLEPGRRLLGWEPRDRWPQGLPFALDEAGDGAGDGAADEAADEASDEGAS